VPNNIQTRAPLRSTPSAHEAMFAPSVSHAVVRGVSVAPFRAGSSRHRPRPARHVARPVRSASSSAAENENSEGIDALSDVTRAVLAFHAAERNGNGDRGRGGERAGRRHHRGFRSHLARCDWVNAGASAQRGDVLNEPASERRGDDGDLEALERDATNRSCPMYSLYVRRAWCRDVCRLDE